jgi:hypothetical protein
VTRSDATRAFVDRLRAAGHQAQLLDLRHDDLGGPYDAVLADAVLLYLSRDQFQHAPGRIRRGSAPAGLLAMTLKEGDGEGWSTAKLGLRPVTSRLRSKIRGRPTGSWPPRRPHVPAPRPSGRLITHALGAASGSGARGRRR